jgi:hypothetical protein
LPLQRFERRPVNLTGLPNARRTTQRDPKFINNQICFQPAILSICLWIDKNKLSLGFLCLDDHRWVQRMFHAKRRGVKRHIAGPSRPRMKNFASQQLHDLLRLTPVLGWLNTLGGR